MYTFLFLGTPEQLIRAELIHRYFRRSGKSIHFSRIQKIPSILEPTATLNRKFKHFHVRYNQIKECEKSSDQILTC
jgi:hypothetical protein